MYSPYICIEGISYVFPRLDNTHVVIYPLCCIDRSMDTKPYVRQLPNLEKRRRVSLDADELAKYVSGRNSCFTEIANVMLNKRNLMTRQYTGRYKTQVCTQGDRRTPSTRRRKPGGGFFENKPSLPQEHAQNNAVRPRTQKGGERGSFLSILKHRSLNLDKTLGRSV